MNRGYSKVSTLAHPIKLKWGDPQLDDIITVLHAKLQHSAVNRF